MSTGVQRATFMIAGGPINMVEIGLFFLKSVFVSNSVYEKRKRNLIAVCEQRSIGLSSVS